MPWFAISREPIPIEDAIGGVAVLLDLDNEITGSNRVQPAAWEKQRVAGPNRDAMNMRGDIAALYGLNEAVTLTKPQSDKQLGVLGGIGNIPKLGLRFATELRRQVGWGMDLHRKLLMGIEQFDQQRKSLALWKVAENISLVILPEIVQSLSTERPTQNNTLGFRSIADLPSFADLRSRWQLLAVDFFETSPSPDSLHENGRELQRCSQEVGAHVRATVEKRLAFAIERLSHETLVV